jgi:AcrR family transcriptional regulator
MWVVCRHWMRVQNGQAGPDQRPRRNATQDRGCRLSRLCRQRLQRDRIAGIALRGAFSHHFATKKDLGLAVIRDRVRNAVESTWILPVLAAHTAAGGIEQVFEAIASDVEKSGSVSGCPLNNLALELSSQDADFRQQLDEIFLLWRDAISDKLKADLAVGRSRFSDPDAMATFVVATYSGAMAMAKASQSVQPLRACLRIVLDVIRG